MWIDKNRLKKAWLWARIRQIRLKRWWFKNDRRYGIFWRLGNGAAAVLILVSVVVPVIQQIANDNSYHLNADALKLVGNTDPALAKQLTYDQQTGEYQFNKDAIKDDASNPLASLKAQVGTANGQGKNKSLYALDVPKNMTKGVTYHDINSSLSFSLVPEFKASTGKVVSGHLVYPLRDNTQAVYTLKNNGLKEDIVVQKPSQNTMSFRYHFNLPDTLEVKAIPDSNGAIGIYSADPTLFGNISYGSDADRAAVAKARAEGAKNYLVFGLPNPVIKTPDGQQVGSGSFDLNGNNLTVVATGLKGIKTPITIDPSVVVTSSSDFQTAGNNEGNIDFSTSGQIGRAGLVGGTVGTWATTTSMLTNSRQSQGAVAYNGYLYMVGGSGLSGYYNDVQYAPLNSSDGTVGAWHYTHNSTDDSTTFVAGFTTTRDLHSLTVYNGYMYVLGGRDSGGTVLNDAQYAPINANGTIGTWATTTSFTTPRFASAAVASNGYIYLLGGTDNTTTPTLFSDVQYAALNADGTIGTWATTTALPSARYGHTAATYNGYIYLVGGYDGAYKNDVQYAPLNADGTIGTWIATSTFTNGRRFHGSVISNGNLYVIGGFNNIQGYQADVQYAPINANGSVGTWVTTSSIIGIRRNMATAAYNGYTYILGGFHTLSDTTCSPGSQQYCNDIQYAKIDPAGTASAYAAGTNFTTTRRGAQTVAYNGFLYVLGGDNGGAGANTISAATLNTTTGVLGSFSSVGMTPFTSGNGGPNNLTFFSAVAYGGFMYLLGGCTSAYASCTTGSNDIAGVYKSTIASGGGLGAWTAQTSFTTGRYGLGAVAYNNTMYIMGGINATTFQNDIQYQTFGASGVLTGVWTTSTKTITTARAYFGAAVYGNNLYVVGGCSAGALTCTTALSDVQSAAFTNSSGTGGDLAANTSNTGNSSFTNARGMHGLAVVNGYLYISGGLNNGTMYSDTQYAPINTNGTVGTWVTSTASVLATTRYGVGMAAQNGYLYVTGGYNGTTYYNNTHIGVVGNGGSGSGANTWTTNGTGISGLYPSGWRYGQMFAYNGYLYIAGGEDNTATAYADVYYAPISADGSVGSWTATTTMTTTRFTFGLALYNGFVYVIGGRNTAGTSLNTIEYASFNSNGTLSSWTASGNTFTTRNLNAAVAYRGYLYTLGGQNNGGTAQNDTQYAQINSDGTVGTWATTNTFTGNRYGLGAAVYNGYIYVIGGFAAGTYLNDVQYAPLNSDGTITSGTWGYTTSLQITRRYLNAMASNGILYVVNGANASTNYRRVESAPILANGTIGSWQTSGADFSAARNNAGAVIYNGNLYVAGGYNGVATYPTDLQYTPLTLVPRIGHYSKLIDLGVSSNVASVTYNGTAGLGVITATYKVAGSNGIFGSSSLASSISGSGACTGNTQAARYLLISIALDDSTGVSSTGYFPDANGTPANVTDFTVTYMPTHPAPNIRLRAGQTLQTGTLSALDTCYP